MGQSLLIRCANLQLVFSNPKVLLRNKIIFQGIVITSSASRIMNIELSLGSCYILWSKFCKVCVSQER